MVENREVAQIIYNALYLTKKEMQLVALPIFFLFIGIFFPSIFAQWGTKSEKKQQKMDQKKHEGKNEHPLKDLEIASVGRLNEKYETLRKWIFVHYHKTGHDIVEV